jgi:hypothetical protein
MFLTNKKNAAQSRLSHEQHPSLALAANLQALANAV